LKQCLVILTETPMFNNEMIVSLVVNEAIPFKDCNIPLDLAEITLRHVYRNEVGANWGQGNNIDNVAGGFALLRELITQARAHKTSIGEQFGRLIAHETSLRFIWEPHLSERVYIHNFLAAVFERIDLLELMSTDNPIGDETHEIDVAIKYASRVLRKLATADGCSALGKLRSRLPSALEFEKKNPEHSTDLYFGYFSSGGR
jgi:hypothetical protein